MPSPATSGIDTDPTTTDVHVLLDGTALADGGINVNAACFNDTTGLYAKVANLGSPVPEASTSVSLGLLAAFGIDGLAVSTRRKKATALARLDT